ncbi:hypothetical protein BUE80_DR002287 [Diplocarpon rosae]|nr:hypothetical protein BUE80_DR002287 [Diplocarpon rosae]
MDRDAREPARDLGKRKARQLILHNSPLSSSSSFPPHPGREKSKVKKKKKAITSKATAQEYWSIKRIVKQEQRADGLYYLVDWADNEITGESYPIVDWVRYSDVTVDAVAAWQKSWQKQPASRSLSPQLFQSKEPESESSFDSQPIRSAKRRRLVSKAEIVAQEESSPAEPQSVPRGQALTQLEIPDSYEYEYDLASQVNSNTTGQICGEEEVSEDREATDHGSDSLSQTSLPAQSSGSSQAAKVCLASDIIEPSSSKAAGGTRRPFLWDEDVEEIPDSQDQGGSSSFESLETPISRSEEFTFRNTQSNTEASLEAIEFRNTQFTSSNSYSKASSNLSQFAEPRQPNQVDLGEWNSSSGPQSSRFRAGSILNSLSDSRLPCSLESEQPEHSAELQSQGIQPEVTSSPRSYQYSPHLGLSQISVPQFSTQVSRSSDSELLSGEIVAGENQFQLSQSSNLSARIWRDQDQQVQISAVESTLNRDPQRHCSLVQGTQSQISACGSVPPPPRSFPNLSDREASKVISHTPEPQSSLPRPRLSGSNETQLPSDIASQPEDVRDPEPTRIQVQDTQRSTHSQSSGTRSQVSSSSHLPSPPIEDVQQSIEIDSPAKPSSKFQPPLSSPVSVNVCAIMKPSSKPTPQRIDPVARVKELYQQRVAAREAERAASAARADSVTLSPALPLLNQQAVSLTQRSPIQKPEQSLLSGAQSSTLPVADSAPISLPMEPPTAHSSADQDADSDSKVEQPQTSLDIRVLGQDEYNVPLPMVGLTRSIYVHIIEACQAELLRFRKDGILDASIIAEISSTLDKLEQVCSHADLIDNAVPSQESSREQAKFAENISTKAILLAELLPLLQQTDKHVIILVRPGRMLHVLQSLLSQHRVMYCRADEPGSWTGISNSGFRVTLYPTGIHRYPAEPASLLIAFDSTCSSLPYLKELRTDPSIVSRLVPLLSLVVANSVEHLEKCLEPSLRPFERNLILYNCTTQLMDLVGIFDENIYPAPPDAAKAIADFLKNGASAESWTLQPMPTINGLELNIMSSQQFSSEEPTASASDTYSSQSSSQILQSGAKRQLLLGQTGAMESPKRQRLTPVPGELKSSHVSDTVLRTVSDPAGPSLSNPGQLEREGTDVVALLNRVRSSHWLVSLDFAKAQKVTDLEAQLRQKDAIVLELRQINKNLEARCKDYENSFASIQPRYQEAINDRGSFEHEYNLAMAREIQARKRGDNRDAEILKLREKNTTLEGELTTARTALANSTIPQAAELAKIREELDQARLGNTSLQKRISTLNNDLDYIRDSYQTASEKAMKAQAENNSLVSENALLREKDKTDKVRIHEIQSSHENIELRQENRQLKARTEDLQRASDRMSEELKLLMNGRRATTRGASVPRSPRPGPGSQMSPGSRQSVSRALQYGGSRSNSPAPGDLAGNGQFNGRVGGQYERFGDAGPSKLGSRFQ